MSSGPKTTTTTSDPWKNMPDWLKSSFEGRTEDADQLWDAAKGMDAPDILNMNEKEYAAYNKLQADAGRSDAISDDAYSTIAGAGANLGGYSGGYKPTDFTQGSDPSSFDNTYTGDRMTALLGDKDFGLDYTDNVVDTTLAGMQRQADRDRLLRQSQGASTGGISNTRSAVADAISGGETARAMAEQEASLRDTAQRFETDSLFKQAGALDASDQFKSGLDQSSAIAANEARLKELGLSDEAARFLSEQTLEEQKLGNADQKWGAEFDLTKGGALEGLADSGAKRNMAIYDLMKNFGMQERGINQAQEDQQRDHMGWLSNMLSGTNLTTSNPTGTTQTSTAPGNSALQNAMGIGTSLAGMYMSSDENVKEDISPLEGEDALKAVMDLRPAEYKYKEGYGHRKDRHKGLIAQSAEGIPNAVKSFGGVKHIDAFPILATVVAAVQELKKERDDEKSNRR